MKPKEWLRWALPLVLIAAALATVFLFAGFTRPMHEALYLTPTLTDPCGWELYRVEAGQKIPLAPEELPESAGTVCLTRTLDPAWEQAGYTFVKLDGSEWQMAVYLDGELLYSVVPGMARTPEEADFPAGYTGLSGRGESVNVTLPAGWGGKELTIAARRVEWRSMPMVILTSGAIEQESAVTAANKIGFTAAAFAVAALLLLGLFLYGGRQERWDWPLLLLALAAFSQVLYWLREYSMGFVGAFPLDIPLAAFFPHFFVLLPQICLTVKMTGRRRKLCALAVGICGGASMFSVILASLPLSSWLMAGLYLGTLAVAVFGALEAKGGSRVFKLFFQGLAFLLGAYLLCVALSLLVDGELTGDARIMFCDAAYGSNSAFLRWIGEGLFLLCAFLSVMETISHAAETQAQVELLSSRNELARENLRILQESGVALAKTRHDILGHLNALQALNRGREYARMEEYLDQITQQTSMIAPMKLTDHPVANAILLRYSERAKRAGTRFECHVELPGSISVPDIDLSTFLTNLLSNALEAARGKDSWIEVTMHLRGKYLFIECQNSYIGTLTRDEETGLYRSRRGAGHGWGMKIMEDIAHRYQSELQVEGKDGVFLARTALLMPENGPKAHA